MLHLVGETITPKQAHLQANKGELIPIVRGVYASAVSDVNQVIRSHAVRIAHYLYPTAYLASVSSLNLTPTSDGRLFLSGRRNQRTRLRTLEIIQNEAPPSPSLIDVIVGDDMGEMHAKASSPRQRFLEAFRLRSEHASAITEDIRAATARRLRDEFGSPDAIVDALWPLARENGWLKELEGAQRYLKGIDEGHRPVKNKSTINLIVAWNKKPVGTLIHDGAEWRWKPSPAKAPPLIRDTHPGKLPSLVESLLPEGWLAQILEARDDRDFLRSGRRYMSNIDIVPSSADLNALPEDVLQSPLAAHSDHGRFTGTYKGPARDDIESTFEQNLARVFIHAQTPRLSGVQIKAPMCLTSEGELKPAIDLPFTHIMKPAGTSGFEGLPVVEWLCLELGRGAGFETPNAALIAMPEGMPPALLVERFDIRSSNDDRRWLAMEDFCSVLDQPASTKYDGTIEKIGRGLRPLSTQPNDDMKTLFMRALFAWLIADGDMHLKNLALLKTTYENERYFKSVRFAPLYDAVTTRVFPGLGHDRMALKVNGKDDRLKRRDFVQLAQTLGITVIDAVSIMTTLIQAVIDTARILELPDLDYPAQIRDLKSKIQEIVARRTDDLLNDAD